MKLQRYSLNSFGKPFEDEKGSWVRYVDVAAIPKLDLTDLQMRQVRDLLGVALWIRSLQANPEGVELPDILGDLDSVFIEAQFQTALRLVVLFDHYLKDHTTIARSADVWPRTQGEKVNG